MFFCRLVSAMVSALHRQAHRTGRTRDGAHCCIEIGRGQVGFLRLGDLLELLAGDLAHLLGVGTRSEEHTSELQSLMRISYAVFCLKKKNNHNSTKYAYIS